MNPPVEDIHCSCGEARYGIKGEPLLRAYCHCGICQAYNERPFADITLYRAKDIEIPAGDRVEYTSLRFPWILRRGKCASCGKAAIEKLNIFPMPPIIIVPRYNFADGAQLPKPSLHMFYDKRVEDIDDDLPKFSGYLSSQTGFSRKLLASLFKALY